MELEIREKGLHIIASSGQDKAFLSDTLGIKNPGDTIELKRLDNEGFGLEYVMLSTVAQKEEKANGK